MLDDVNAQSADLKVCDQAVELGETGGRTKGNGDIKKPPIHLSKRGLAVDLGVQMGAVDETTLSVTPEGVYRVN